MWHEVTGAKLAPKDEATLNELRNKRPQEQLREIPGDALNFQREALVQLDRKLLATSLRGAPSGSSLGPGGCSYEMLRVLLDDREGLLLLTAAVEDFARGDVSHYIFSAFMLATLTALQKRRGGVRGIAMGTSFRRLVAKTLARQFMGEGVAPHSSLHCPRAGTDWACNQSPARHDEHVFRSQVAQYAQGHDQGMMVTMEALLGGSSGDARAEDVGS